MKIEENIFILQNFDDIPDDLKAEIIIKEDKTRTEHVYSLFNIKNILNINEIIIGCYRGYKYKVMRKTAFAICANLRKKGLIKKIGKAKFEIIK